MRNFDDSYCDRIRSSLTAVHCFDNGNVGKQPMAWNYCCAKYWLKDLQESTDRCTGRRDITEDSVKHHTINESLNRKQ